MIGSAPSAGARSWAHGAARESTVILFAALVYAGVRVLTEGSRHRADENGRRLLHIERALHLDWEGALQSPVLAHRWLTTLVNWDYIWGFWPVLAGTAVLLYARHRDEYALLRSSIFVSGLIGFAFFALLPVAPPRLVDPQLTDTIRRGAGWYRTMQPLGLTNRYAAMPSLHFGWSLLVGYAVWQAGRRRVAYVFAVLIPAAMAFSVVATANHYVLDVAVGGIVAVLSLVLVTRLERTVVRSSRGTGRRLVRSTDVAGTHAGRPSR